MIPPKRFGEVLSELSSARRFSLAELAELAGGRALLKRAMHDELPMAKLEQLCARLCENDALTAGERHALKEGLAVSRFGVQEYLTRAALLNLMDSGDTTLANEPIACEEFCQRVQAIASSDVIRILCLNCCYPSLFTLLAQCFQSLDRDIQMRHYVRLERPGCDAASLVYCTAPIMGDPRYLPYSISRESDTQFLEGDFGIIYAQKGGKRTEIFFLMKNNTELYMLPPTTQLKLTTFMESLVGDMFPKPTPIKELNAPGTRHVDMTIRYLAHELNRATYTISADLAYLQIPPDIASVALDAQYLNKLTNSSSEAEQMIQTMRSRYQNFYNKKKPNYQIVSYTGIKRFLETGKPNGSFYGFRAFTPEERMSIIGDVLERSRSNPYYHLHIFKNLDYQVKFTTVGFEKLGVSVFPKRIDERTRASFNYLFLTIPEFTKHFIEHYLSVMVGEYCYDEETTYDMLHKLLEDYRASVEPQGEID